MVRVASIKRDNISLDAYQEVQRRFAAEGVATYSDLILGLPGETYESFARLIGQRQFSGGDVAPHPIQLAQKDAGPRIVRVEFQRPLCVFECFCGSTRSNQTNRQLPVDVGQPVEETAATISA